MARTTIPGAARSARHIQCTGSCLPADVAESGRRDGYRTLCDRKGMTSLSETITTTRVQASDLRVWRPGRTRTCTYGLEVDPRLSGPFAGCRPRWSGWMSRPADTALSCGVVPGGMTKLPPASTRAASQWPSVTPRIRSARLVASVADPAGARRTEAYLRPSLRSAFRAGRTTTSWPIGVARKSTVPVRQLARHGAQAGNIEKRGLGIAGIGGGGAEGSCPSPC
jgi:hypothetical protein